MSNIPPPPGGAPPPPGGTPPPPGGLTPGAPAPGQWGQPTPPGMPMPPPQQSSQTNGLAIAALIVGILSIPLAFACGIGGLFGIAAIVLGFLGLKKANDDLGGGGKGLAVGGIVTGGLGLLAVIAWVVLFFVVADSVDDIDGINSDPSNGVCNEDRFLQDPDC